ncbi:hypothetical protein chiPu_0002830 [Chiloscyllium punctatum]|uniref:Cilia- and flagella-associated protein 91 n=1 Tax=Chiloscyllium punctatum TaxID=137246 RepID=A0A401S209_CHIPU|nr:hypothetical protein [Chiloscyllium punctatum]
MSFTIAQSVREKQRFKPERPHDYLYDPLYSVASEKDHAKMSMKAFTSANRFKKVPDYKTMFSNLERFPSYTIQLDCNDPVPKFVDQRWRGYGEKKQEAIKQLAMHDPSLKMQLQIEQDPQVSGKNRYKYFTRPIIPFVQQLPVNAILDVSKLGEKKKESEERKCQTVKLAIIGAVCTGRGLPAGLAEVEMIERARAKRAWEATLPPLSDRSQLEKRKRMMEAMERNEWAFREQEIEKLQEIRLDVLMKLLSQREAKQQEMNVKRVDSIWSKLQQKKGVAIKKIRLKHIKEIRKLTAKRRNVEGKLERRNCIQDYANYGSQVYAPVSRNGRFPDQNAECFIVKSHFLSTLNGILELEETLPDFVTQPRIRIQRPKKTTKDGTLNYAARREMELAKIHKGEEERYLAIIYLQKLIRGRTVQNMMFEGKEKRIELIQELRTTHALQEDKQLLKQAEMQAILALQYERNLQQQKLSTMEDYLSHVEGHILADMFDFLNKELLRLQEERRIHAIVMLAERRRRIREAEESGLRQVEERRRREEDEIFKQVVKVHQTTVDSYLEDILLKSVQDTAEDQARQEIRKMADEINDIAYNLEQHRTELQAEEIVSELVHGFLIPEAHKIIMRERVKHFQSRHLLVAHRIIHNEAEHIMTNAAPAVSASSSAATDILDQVLTEVEKEMMKETQGS